MQAARSRRALAVKKFVRTLGWHFRNCIWVDPRNAVIPAAKRTILDHGQAAKGKRKRRCRKKSKKEGMKLDQVSVVPVAAASLNVAAAAFVPLSELQDEWADSAPVVYGPATLLAPQHAARETERGRQPRRLVPRRSGTRSPRREEQQLPQPDAAPAPSPLLVRHFASIKGLEARPSLNGTSVRLVFLSSLFFFIWTFSTNVL